MNGYNIEFDKSTFRNGGKIFVQEERFGSVLKYLKWYGHQLLKAEYVEMVDGESEPAYPMITEDDFGYIMAFTERTFRTTTEEMFIREQDMDSICGQYRKQNHFVSKMKWCIKSLYCPELETA